MEASQLVEVAFRCFVESALLRDETTNNYSRERSEVYAHHDTTHQTLDPLNHLTCFGLCLHCHRERRNPASRHLVRAVVCLGIHRT